MHYNLTAEQVLANLIHTLETSLSELRSAKSKTEFIEGEWYAYIECLEVLFYWKKAKKFGLDYNPEARFNII